MSLWVREITFANADAVADVRPDHRAHMCELLERGALRMAGPWVAGGGAYIVYEAPDESSVRALIAEDPYTVEGVVTEQALREWTVATGS